jgi:polar amino acid transport system substrate-binding protein
MRSILRLMTSTLMVLLGAALAAGPAPAQIVVRVGSTPTGVPFTFLDTKTNTIQGFMVDLITELGKDAGFEAKIEPMQFSALIPALTTSKIDAISAAMYITDKRKEVIDFSAPVYSYGEGLVVPKADTKDYAAFAELKGTVVGAQIGTVYVEPLQKSGLFSEVKIYDTIPDILRDVNAGRLKAGFADYPILAYNLGQGAFPEVRLVKSFKATIVGSIGVGTRQNDPMLQKIDASLAKLKGAGRVDAMLEKWSLK